MVLKKIRPFWGLSFFLVGVITMLWSWPDTRLPDLSSESPKEIVFLLGIYIWIFFSLGIAVMQMSGVYQLALHVIAYITILITIAIAMVFDLNTHLYNTPVDTLSENLIKIWILGLSVNNGLDVVLVFGMKVLEEKEKSRLEIEEYMRQRKKNTL